MKKILLLFIFICTFFIILPINSKAMLYDDDLVNYASATPISPNKKYNLFKGLSSIDNVKKQGLYDFLTYELAYEIIKGGFIYKVKFNENDSYLNVYGFFENRNLTLYQIFIDEKLIYELKFIDEDYQISYSEETDLNTLFGYNEDGYSISSECNAYYDQDSIFLDGVPGISEEDLMHILNFDFLYGVKYEYNSTYENSDVHIVVDEQNPLTLEQIYEIVNVVDETDGALKPSVIDNTYILSDGKIDIGQYYFTIKAMDKAGNITLQKCIIDVCDITPPKITTTDCSVNYRNKVNFYFYIKYSDDAKCYIETIEDNYSPNYNIPGNYSVKVRAWDIYGNESFATLNIEVVDRVPPAVVVEQEPHITTLDNFEIDDFRQFISVIDEIEGEILDYEIIDLDSYLDNSRTAGVYRFEVVASDGINDINYTFKVFVDDEDYPQIVLNAYTIVVDEGHVLTKEEILSILKNINQISSDDVEIETSYNYNLDANNESGSYELIVKDSNGNVYHNTIEVLNDEKVDFTNGKSATKNYTFLYLGVSLAAVILLIGIMSVVVYKKKH